MEKLAEIKEKLKGLSQQEMEELKAFLTEERETTIEETTDDKSEGEVKGEENSDTNTKADENAEVEALPENKPEKHAETQDDAEVEELPPEAKETQIQAENGENKGNEKPQQEPISNTPDDKAIMKKCVVTCEDDTVDKGAITAESGEKLPIDYEQIVEGLNAKIAALEAENASLKNKVEGAFGYSSKPTTPAKVNRLYDECEGLHLHK